MISPPWMSKRITGLRLPNSPPHTPTRRSRLPWAMAGARPLPRMSPLPSAPAVKPRRVMPDVGLIADADRGNAVGLGEVGEVVGAGDLVGGARRSHDRVVDALGVGADLLDEDHRRRLELLAKRGRRLLAGGIAQRILDGERARAAL